MFVKLLFFVVLFSAVAFVHGSYPNHGSGTNHSAPTATIDVGLVVGTTTSLPSATVSVNKFLGIPFAVSPPRRFEPPEPAKNFSRPLNATQWSHSCMQQFNCESIPVIISTVISL